MGVSAPSEIGLGYSETEQLFLSLAEQMKVPLMQIARHAEAAGLLGNSLQALQSVHTQADVALKLVDGYMLSMRLASQQHNSYEMKAAVGPVSVSSMLYDTAHQLTPIAKLYGVELEIEMAGKYGPVEGSSTRYQSRLSQSRLRIDRGLASR